MLDCPMAVQNLVVILPLHSHNWYQFRNLDLVQDYIVLNKEIANNEGRKIKGEGFFSC